MAIADSDERNDPRLDIYTRGMEQVIRFLSMKAKETELEGFNLQKAWVCRDLATYGKQDTQDTQDSRKISKEPFHNDQSNWMDRSEGQKEDDGQYNKELRGRLRDLHYEKLSKAVLSSITEV